MSTRKEQLYTACQQQINERLKQLNATLTMLQESANQETKSSAGDKYETGRAMLQQEKDKIQDRLAQAKQQKQVLDQLSPQKICEVVEFGALVETNKNLLFLACGLGKIKVAKESFFVLSPNAPLAQMLLGKKVGDAIEFRGQKIKINHIL